MTAPTIRTTGYGWHPDLPDTRDKLFSKYLGFCKKHLTVKAAEVDLRPDCPPVYDQGAIGSCTANSIGAMFQFVNKKDKGKDFIPSRLFIYYNERVIENTIPYDSGAFIRDGIKTVNTQGVCPETMWVYEVRQFATKPPDTCYTEALNHQSIQYMRVNRSLTEMKACLSQGYPFVFGFTVYESFESAKVANTGVVPMPARGERAIGGHAVMAVGYDSKTKMMLVRNSWGTDWGLGGYFWMPFGYFTDANLSDDFWTIRSVEV
jgi:C1A family cysteine protease